jgi:hypothetical protein
MAHQVAELRCISQADVSMQPKSGDLVGILLLSAAVAHAGHSSLIGALALARVRVLRRA